MSMHKKSDFYKHDRVAHPTNQYKDDVVRVDPEMEKFQSLVFAPDPLTGNPTSDVHYLLYGTDEGFKQFVKQRLFTPGTSGAVAATAEEAEKFVKPNVMTREQYLSFMKEYAVSQMSDSLDSE